MPFTKTIARHSSLLILLLSSVLFFDACKNSSGPRLLVFSKTNGFKHSSIPFANAALYKLGKENGFSVDTTKDSEMFTDETLKNYDAVVFANTTRNVLNAKQQAAFERFIQAGGGFAGIHSAADTEYEWPWYGKLVGAYFSSHPSNPGVRKAVVQVTDTSHPSTKGLPASWERTDEWYNYKSIYSGIRVVAYLDENSYEGGTNGAEHPIAWYHEFDGGRAFYTGGGHEDSSYSDPVFLRHLLGGIQYAMGDGKLDYSKAYSVEAPEENRFVKTVLINDLNVPMELAVSGDGKVFFTELNTANLQMYDSRTGKAQVVHRFNASSQRGTGLIGIALDPGFSANRHIYVYYSPPKDEEPILFHLSRFTLKEDFTLDSTTEKILLKVPVQLNSGAHHGGSLAWDKDGNLYLSTGDSSSPFPSNGYSPMDERPGQEYYSLDAQRASANTNDLKGKVLRIHPEPDGTYTIPKGNLFPPGTEKTLPEIYTMGCRNPYRIAVNPRTSVLYWGEIGPDAGRDSIQGPRGYDEFNQAKKAGNYGWPYFVGNNYAYAKWDFATSTAGPKFNPEAPENHSPNNTGLTRLPPAVPAMIWYPYAASDEFPELGQGGRSAMAGEFYTYDAGSSSTGKFPEYYEGALFVFDWMRNWVMALRFDKDENYLKSEPFMAANGDFRRPIDLAFGKDGVMYMLEYGSVYGADNDDARLVKIEYHTGNRAPKAMAAISDSAASAALAKRVFLTSENRTLPKIREISGQVPLRVLFSSAGSSDPDDDDVITCEWNFDGQQTSTENHPKFTYTSPGVYRVVLTVKDKTGATGTDTVLVRAGNQKPLLEIATSQNKSFFWPGQTFDYAVKVSDPEDGATDPGRLKVFINYERESGNLSNSLADLSAPPAEDKVSRHPGAILIEGSDCKACHTVKDVSVGPSYTRIAERYKSDKNAPAMLTAKIISGGGGNWGREHVMSAHPQLAPQDIKEMVKYILSLADAQVQVRPAPSEGKLLLNSHKPEESRGLYTLTAMYTDKGAGGIEPLTGFEILRLRSATVNPLYVDAMSGYSRFGNNLTSGGHKSYLMLKNVDLTGIRKFTYEYGSGKEGFIEARIDSYAGPVISSTAFTSTGGNDKMQMVTGEIKNAVNGRHDIYFIPVKKEKPNNDLIKWGWIRFEK